MKPRTALLIFCLIFGSAVVAGVDSLCRTKFAARQAVELALAQTLAACPNDEITADTIRVFRHHLAPAQLQQTAYLAMEWCNDDRRQAVLVAHTGLSLSALWRLSDQRASGTLATLAALWLMCSWWFVRRRMAQGLALSAVDACAGTQPSAAMLTSLGRLSFDPAAHRFFADGREVRFTPMQHELMALFFMQPGHQIGKQDICDHLWPRKPDASATLYTLVRRIKPLIEQRFELHIECERGRSYTLTTN